MSVSTFKITKDFHNRGVLYRGGSTIKTNDAKVMSDLKEQDGATLVSEEGGAPDKTVEAPPIDAIKKGKK